MAIKTAAEKIGLIGDVTTAKVIGDQASAASATASVGPEVAASLAKGEAAAAAGIANQASGDPYSAFPRIAAMAAIMAALGFAVSAAYGGGGSYNGTVNNGTGTVFGDSTAKSESIANAIELLREVDTQTMRYSGQMLVALQSINANIGGLTTLLVRSGGLDGSLAGIDTARIGGFGGFMQNIHDKASGFISNLDPGGLLAGIAGQDSKMIGKLFGTKINVTGQGLYADAQSLASIARDGFQASYYADLEKKSKFIGLTSATNRSTQLTPADAELEQQFSLILNSFSDTVRAAAVPLGLSLGDVAGRLSSFVVDIGKIDLQGLTGDEITEKLSAVFGAAGDRIAQAALPGLERFQAIGEGYLETGVRVATGAEQAQVALRRLGVSVIGLGDLVQAQAEDIGAELVRESIALKEAGSGIAEIVSALSGTAAEISSTYSSLDDVRTALQALGLSGQAVSIDLLQGAGGLDTLADGLKAFQENFLSEVDQIGVKSAILAKQFEALGITMPKSNDQFVALVNGIDTSTAAGQYLLGNVLSLSDGFADLTTAISGVGSSIEDEIKRIRGLGSAGTSDSFSVAQSRFAIATAQARAGDQDAIDNLASYSQDLLSKAENAVSSRAELVRLQQQVAASLQATLSEVRAGNFSSGASGAWTLSTGSYGAMLAGTGQSGTVSTSSGVGGAEATQLLRDIKSQLATIREENQAGALAVASNTGRLVRMLGEVIPEGDTVSVRVLR